MGPQYHFRDIPNMLSGGDLDGDRYWVLWEASIVEPLLDRWQRGLATPPATAHEPPTAAPPTERGGAPLRASSREGGGPLGAASPGQSGRGRCSDTAESSSNCESDSGSDGSEEPEETVRPAAEKQLTGDEAETEREGILRDSAAPSTETPLSADKGLKETQGQMMQETHEKAGRKESKDTEQRDLRRLARFLLRLQGWCQLGVISNTHVRVSHTPSAYYEGNPQRAKALDGLSLALADLAVAAVDAPKTGKKVVIRQGLRCLLVPHFLARHERRQPEFSSVPQDVTMRIFASRSVLGCLYDKVAAVSLRPCFPLPPSPALEPGECLLSK